MAEPATTRIEAARGYDEPDRGPMRGSSKEKPRPKAPAGPHEGFSSEVASDAEEIATHTLDTMV
jgi:hypothetical protein